MRKIKSYKEFGSIKESLGFGNSEEYQELITKYKNISKDYFAEHFYDITDENIVDFKYWLYVGDESGESIGWTTEEIDTSKDYYIYHSIQMDQKNDSLDSSNAHSFEDLKKVGENIHKIVNSIESFKNRISDEFTISSIGVNTIIGVTPSIGKISIRIKGDKIKSEDIKLHYNKWKKSYGPKFDEGLKYLIGEYKHQKNRPDYNPPLDTNDTGDTVLIGFMGDDEIIVVATYFKKEDRFRFDWAEFQRSLRE